jgi:hypothetical protein
MKRHFWFILVISFLCTISCKKELDIAKSESEIKSVIGQFYHLYETQDIDLFSRLVAHDGDMVNFGTDAVEYWVGFESLKKGFQKQWASFKNSRITLKDPVIKMSRSGTVAWFSMFVSFQVEFKEKTVVWTDARTTGVVEKRDGNWVVVQFHNSMPVLEQAARY